MILQKYTVPAELTWNNAKLSVCSNIFDCLGMGPKAYNVELCSLWFWHLIIIL